MSWSIRRSSVDDWADLRDVRLRALKDSPEAFSSSYEDAVEFDEATWRGYASADSVCFLAYDGDGPPVGMAASYWNKGVLELVAMWVGPEARGMGVADALVDAVYDQAAQDGVDELHLWVTETNPAARRFYERLGFAYTGEREPMRGRERLMLLGMTRATSSPQ